MWFSGLNFVQEVAEDFDKIAPNRSVEPNRRKCRVVWREWEIESFRVRNRREEEKEAEVGVQRLQRVVKLRRMIGREKLELVSWQDKNKSRELTGKKIGARGRLASRENAKGMSEEATKKKISERNQPRGENADTRTDVDVLCTGRV